jgi:hypothetical protein
MHIIDDNNPQSIDTDKHDKGRKIYSPRGWDESTDRPVNWF